jgi:long-chain acyl-CoA synthetase
MTGLNAPLYVGGKIVLFPNFDAKQILRAIQQYRITVFCGVPTLYSKLLSHPDLEKYDYSSLQFCISGSSSLPLEIQEEFMKKVGGILVEGYGLSEASPVTHCNPLTASPEKLKIGSIGIPWPDTDAKIVDQEKGENVLKPGEIGELVVRGPQVMKGYWQRPFETASVLRDGWLYTGDIGKMDEDGYFYFVDRKKDLIKCRGFSVYPRELEEILHEHPAIKLCSVIGKADDLAGEVPKAVVVLREGSIATEKEIVDFVNAKVASYKAIREVEFRTSLPVTILGKVVKRALRENG